MSPRAAAARTSSADFARRLAAAHAGSRVALGQLLDDCRHYLRVIARANLNSMQRTGFDSVDLVQDTLVLAISGFGEFRGGDETQLLAWLRRILLNHLATLTAKPANRLVTLQPEDEPTHLKTPSWQAMQEEGAEALHEAMRQLAAAYRQVLIFRYSDRMNWEEIGVRLDRSANAVRMIHCRALRELGRLLEETNYTPHGRK